MLRRLFAAFDRQDAIVLLGLGLLGGGLATLSPALSLVVVGGLLFAVGVGVFAPRGGKT